MADRTIVHPDVFRAVVDAIGKHGYQDDIAWAESIMPPVDANAFASELIFVICNSGMRFTVARGIYDRVMESIALGNPAELVFGHAGKRGAINRIWGDRERLFEEFRAADDKVAWLGSLPWIGPITKYHAAKNFGVDCVKPDVHLARLAAAFATTPDVLCRGIADQVGLRVATVDTVLWRACAIGLINSKTGVFDGDRA